MEEEIIKGLKSSDSHDKLAIDLRAAVAEDYDLIEDIELPDEYKKIAFEIILNESVKEIYKEFNKKLQRGTD